MGRPPSINLEYTDCRYPMDYDPSVVLTDTAELGCEWQCGHPSQNVLIQATQSMHGNPDLQSLASHLSCTTSKESKRHHMQSCWSWTKRSANGLQTTSWHPPMSRRIAGPGPLTHRKRYNNAPLSMSLNPVSSIPHLD